MQYPLSGYGNVLSGEWAKTLACFFSSQADAYGSVAFGFPRNFFSDVMMTKENSTKVKIAGKDIFLRDGPGSIPLFSPPAGAEEFQLNSRAAIGRLPAGR